MNAMQADSRRGAITIAASGALFVLSIAIALSFGSESIALSHFFDAGETTEKAALLDARLPRVLLGAIAGAGLAAVGTAFQSVLRNPLAEPFVLGVSGGAALGATVAILLGLGSLTSLASAAPWLGGVIPWLTASLVPLAALVGGILATVFVYALARSKGDVGGTSILLAGIVVNSICAAVITLLKTLVSATQAQRLLFWLVGFLDVQSFTHIFVVGAYVAAGSIVLLVDAGRLNLLALGDEQARHLGIDVAKLERRTFFACSLVVGAIVSLTGFIGFVGLVVPHALRRIHGPDVRVILPASLFAGGALLVLCDAASRILFRWIHNDLPVGAVTALLGGPVFLLLLRRR